MSYKINDILFQEDLSLALSNSIKIGSQGHLLISGPPGCGQSMAVNILTSNLGSKKRVKTLLPHEVISGNYQETLKQLKREINDISGNVLYIPNFEDFFLEDFSKSILDYILLSLKQEKFTLIVATDVEGAKRINMQSPELYRRFLLAKVKKFTPLELEKIFLQIVKQDGGRIAKNDIDFSINELRKMRSSGNLKNGRIPRAFYQSCRRLSILANREHISRADIASAAKLYATGVADGYQQLEDLIGLAEVKKVVKLWLANYSIFTKRESLGIDTSGMSQHMVFMGPPGTAKTSVARIVGNILAENGVLSSGHIIETSRTDLVGASSEATFKKVTEAVKRAMGGVLFIDEAYSLATGHGEDDFGKDAVEAILKYMEDYREEFVVVAAGYAREMEKFMSSNPGLRSRFSKKLDFPGYEMDELIKILDYHANKRGFTIEKEVYDHVRVDLKVAINYPSFGNGRYIRDILEDAISKQATRLTPDMPDSEFLLLKVEDFTKDGSMIKISLL